MNDFKYKIALIAPSLYGQFNNLSDPNIVLNGLLKIGFDDVFEVGRAAEYVSQVSNILLNRKLLKKPVISNACPACVELILMKYHNLADHLLPTLAPVDVAAKMARERALNAGIPKEDIGVYFISPCPAKVFALKAGMGVSEPYVDRVLSTADAYMRLVTAMGELDKTSLKQLSRIGSEGLQWGISRGEANSTFLDKTIAADGIENCIRILEMLEDGGLTDIDFIELGACTSGCVGGVMNGENPFVSRSRMRSMYKRLPIGEYNKLADTGKSLDDFLWEQDPVLKDVFKLDADRVKAMGKLMEIEAMMGNLAGTDCGLCGAPSCRAFAEDLVGGEIPPDSACTYKTNGTVYDKTACADKTN
jgi:hypothetical protein